MKTKNKFIEGYTNQCYYKASNKGYELFWSHPGPNEKLLAITAMGVIFVVSAIALSISCIFRLAYFLCFIFVKKFAAFFNPTNPNPNNMNNTNNNTIPVAQNPMKVLTEMKTMEACTK